MDETFLKPTREAAKKSSFFSGTTTKREGGVSARPLRKKELFKKLFFLFVAVKKKFLMGGKGLSGRTTFFLRLPQGDLEKKFDKIDVSTNMHIYPIYIFKIYV